MFQSAKLLQDQDEVEPPEHDASVLILEPDRWLTAASQFEIYNRVSHD